MWMIFAIFYLVVGFIYGLHHVKHILSLLHQAETQEKYLRDMISMHNLTPMGAEYYIQLQEMKINQFDLLEEVKLWKQDQEAYTFWLFLMGFLLWPYYAMHVKTK